jgi:hypothetical protein
LDFCAKDIELDEYTELWKRQHELSDQDYADLKKAIEGQMQEDVDVHGCSIEETTLYKLVEYLAKNEHGQRDEIATFANESSDTIQRRARFLKGVELLRSDKSGYRFTAKGVRFFKRWLVERRLAYDASNASTFKGQEEGEYVTPKSVRNERNGRTEKTERTGNCEVCGQLGKLHYSAGRGVVYLCDKCLADWEGKL